MQETMPSGAFRALRPIILASSSPRRRELLGSLGIDFTIKVVDGSEPAPTLEDDPAAYAMRAAQAKAEAVARGARNARRGGPRVRYHRRTARGTRPDHPRQARQPRRSPRYAAAPLEPDAYRIHGVLHHLAVGSRGKPDGTVLRRRRRDLRGVARRRAPRLRGHRRMRRQGRLLRHTGPRLLPCLGNQRPMGDNRGPPRTCRGAKAYGWGKYRSSSLFGNKSFIEIEDTRTQF